MEFVAMNDALSKIQGDTSIRAYLGAVAQDPQNETIDYVKTKEAVDDVKVRFGDAYQARLKLITNLNNIFFLIQAIREEGKLVITAKLWIWENHTRLDKMIAVAMVLEGNDQRHGDAKPELSDIPYSLVILNGLIREWGRNDFDHLAGIRAATITENGPDEFYALYMGQE